MTAEELLVERFLELERKVKNLEEDIEIKQDEVDTAMEELADHDNLVQILSKYIKVTKYGVSFDLKNFIEDEKADIDYLYNYFDLEFDEDDKNEV